MQPGSSKPKRISSESTGPRVSYRFRTFPAVFLWFALGFDDPGCYYQVIGGLTVATRWQLSSPRGPESYNSQYSGKKKVATLKSPGAGKLQLSSPLGLDSCSPGRQNPKEYHQNARVLEFLPISHVSLRFPVVCVGFRRPGLQLSSPRGPDSGDPVATIKSPGT